MKFDGKVNVVGRLQVIMNGSLERDINNLVVDVGKEWVAGMMTGVGNVISHMGVGTGANAAAGAQTDLTTNVIRKTLQTAGGSATGASVQYSCTYNDGEGNGALREAGLFDSASAGTMLARTVYDEINKGSGDVMTIVWTITVA